MSLQVEKYVSIFDGAHFRAWEAQMTAFLQSQGLWHIANGTWVCLTLVGATAAMTWTNLQMQFVSGGISSIYQDFKAAMAMKIGTSNSAKNMMNLYTYLKHLWANQMVIPEYIQGMMLLNAIPNKWDHVVAYYVQQQQMVNSITFTTPCSVFFEDC